MTSFNSLHPLNVSRLIYKRDFGSSILLSDTQPLNSPLPSGPASIPRYTMFSPICTSSSAEHPEKVPPVSDLILSGKVMLLRLVQLRKAPSIVPTLFARVTFFKFLHPLKKPAPITSMSSSTITVSTSSIHTGCVLKCRFSAVPLPLTVRVLVSGSYFHIAATPHDADNPSSVSDSVIFSSCPSGTDAVSVSACSSAKAGNVIPAVMIIAVTAAVIRFKLFFSNPVTSFPSKCAFQTVHNKFRTVICHFCLINNIYYITAFHYNQ